MGTCVRELVCTTAYMWKAKDCLRELAFSFHALGLGDQTQVVRLGGSAGSSSLRNYWIFCLSGQVGLKLTEICLPLPPGIKVLGLKVCATTAQPIHLILIQVKEL